jgi:formate dehydrogenase assembly factor FdhD
MSTSPKRRAKRRAERNFTAHPRCPVCTNEIVKADLVVGEPNEDGKRLKYHRSCQAALEEATKQREVQQAAARVHAAGLVLPDGQGGFG